MKKEFDFKFLNKIMYGGVILVVLYILSLYGLVEKIVELNSALVPVYVGIFVAFITLPIAKKFIKLGLGKKVSAILSLLVIYAVIFAIIAVMIPIIVEQTTNLIDQFPTIYDSLIRNINEFMHNNLNIDKDIVITNDIKNVTFIKDFLEDIVSYSINTVWSIFEFIISAFTAIMMSFFLIQDMEGLKKKFYDLFTKKGTNKGRLKLVNDIEKNLFSYIRGVVLDSIIVGILTSVLCIALGIDYAIVFGILITLLNFIPYIGALLSEVIIALYALTIGGPTFALITFALLIIIQLIDANILQPNIIGKSVYLHPAIIFAGLIVGNSLMGMFGMIIVIPVISTIKIIIVYKMNKGAERINEPTR